MRELVMIILISGVIGVFSFASASAETFTCSSGLTCDYSCNGDPYQLMWSDLTSTGEYSYSFSVPSASRYTCTITVRTCCFTDSESNEVSDIFINNNQLGSTSDECCPQACGSETRSNPIEFTLNPAFTDTAGGGVFVHDLDSDGLLDFVFSSGNSNQAGWLAAYDHWGNKLWSKTGVKMFDYLHHPSAIAGDMDGDGMQEVGYLTTSDQIKIVNAFTGVEEKTVATGTSPNGRGVAGIGIVNLRGVGDRDVVVQYIRDGHYDNDHLKAINLETGAVLWSNNNFIGTEHSIFRQADMDGDGKDDIAGAILLDENGNKMHNWDLNDLGVHMYGLDSIVIADVYYPGVPYPDEPCPGPCKPDIMACSYYDDCSSSSGACPAGEHCCSGSCTEPTYDPPTKPVIHSGPSSCDINTNCGPFRVSSTQPQGKDITYYNCRHEYPDDHCWSDLSDHPSGQIVDLYTVFTWEAQHKFGYKVLAISWGGDATSDRHLIDINDNTGNTRPQTPTFAVTPPSTCVQGQSCGPFSVTSNDPDNDPISYYFNWRDGEDGWNPGNPEYQTVASGTTRTRHHTWQQAGTYEVQIRSADQNTANHVTSGYPTDLITLSNSLLHTVTVTNAGASGESETEASKVSFASASNPLEVIIAETAGADSRTLVVNKDRIVMTPLNPWNWEDPDKVAVGNFRTNRAGLEIFARSSGSDGTCPRGNVEPYRYEECPWVHDAQGAVINKYYLYDSPGRPSWWTGHGVEEVVRIDWDGNAREEIVGKERHEYGGVAILDAPTGTFEKVWDRNQVESMRVYAVDFMGDYREEVIVVDWNGGAGNKVKIFWNDAANTNSKPSYWDQQHYARQKQNWNYYSP